MAIKRTTVNKKGTYQGKSGIIMSRDHTDGANVNDDMIIFHVGADKPVKGVHYDIIRVPVSQVTFNASGEQLCATAENTFTSGGNMTAENMGKPGNSFSASARNSFHGSMTAENVSMPGKSFSINAKDAKKLGDRRNDKFSASAAQNAWAKGDHNPNHYPVGAGGTVGYNPKGN